MFTTKFAKSSYRVYDNDEYKVFAYCTDQKASLELKTGDKISMSLVHFDKYMSIKQKEVWYMSENA